MSDWENQEWLNEFESTFGPEYFMWRDKAEIDQIIKELLSKNVG